MNRIRAGYPGQLDDLATLRREQSDTVFSPKEVTVAFTTPRNFKILHSVRPAKRDPRSATAETLIPSHSSLRDRWLRNMRREQSDTVFSDQRSNRSFHHSSNFQNPSFRLSRKAGPANRKRFARC